MELEDLRNPQRVATQAQDMGMVVPAAPTFLGLDGTVRGEKVPAPAGGQPRPRAAGADQAEDPRARPDDREGDGGGAADHARPRRARTTNKGKNNDRRARRAASVADGAAAANGAVRAPDFFSPSWTESRCLTRRPAGAQLRPQDARRGAPQFRLRFGLRRDRDGAVVLRRAARAAAGHRPQVVRRHGGRRGRRGGRSCRPSGATSSTATAAAGRLDRTARWSWPTRP